MFCDEFKYLLDRFQSFKELATSPMLQLQEYLGDLKNEVDLDSETILSEIEDENLYETISLNRSIIIDRIDLFLKECLSNWDSNVSDDKKDFDQVIQRLKIKINLLERDFNSKFSLKLNQQTASILKTQIEEQIKNLKSISYNHKTIVYIKINETNNEHIGYLIFIHGAFIETSKNLKKFFQKI